MGRLAQMSALRILVLDYYDGDPHAALADLLDAYELGVPHARLDIVVDRNPEDTTEVTVLHDGIETQQGAALAVHIIDPGASGPTCDWARSVRSFADPVPDSVREVIEEAVHSYHHHCTQPDCDYREGAQ